MASSAAPDLRITPSRSRCSSESGFSAIACAMPSTPFSGVRISWLMVARKSLLARLATSAARSASSCSRAARRASVTST